MRIISIVLILYVIQVSVCAVFDYNSESASTASDLEVEEDRYDMKSDKLQSDPEEDDEDLEEGDNSSISNQDDDQDINGEPATQQSAPVAPQQPSNNGDQNRGLPGVSSGTENVPQPTDYSSVNMRGLKFSCICHKCSIICPRLFASMSWWTIPMPEDRPLSTNQMHSSGMAL